MVAIVSGMRAGLELGSREVLGQQGVAGNAQHGRNGQGVFVNVSSGLLVVQNQDDLLVARGHDANVLRTYSSAGVFNDDNADNWASGIVSLRLTGSVNAAGSSIQRVGRDGSTASYAYDTGRGLYLTSEGSGAHDTITWVAAEAQFEWRDGATGATQRFEGAGSLRLLSSRDTSGNALTYAYGAGGFLSAVSTAGGETTFYDYTGSNLTQVRTVAAGVTTTTVRYGYDASNRLATVSVDLTPADNSVADGKAYLTTYTYDGTSKRIASISQSEGTVLSFTWVDAGAGVFKVASVHDGVNRTHAFTYGAGFSTVTDMLGLVTRYEHDVAGQLTKITAPAVAGVAASRQFTYNASGDVTSVTDGEGRSVVFQYDANGNQVLQRDALGNTVTRTFDARNQLLTEAVYRQPDPDEAGAALPGAPASTRFAYDAAGRNLLRFALTAEGRVTEHRYNGFGERLSSITYGGLYPVAGLAADAAPSEAQLTAWASTQDLAALQRVDFAYDGRGQVQSRTTYARTDPAGQGLADGSHSVERYVHDAMGRLLQSVQPGGAATTYTYDGLGRTLSRTDGRGQLQLTQYDDAGRRTVITQANGLMTSSVEDAAGRLISVSQSTAAAGVLGQTKYFYDTVNRLRQVDDPTGVRRWCLYDEAGRKTADVDGNGSMTEYTYDRSGQVVRTTTWGTAVNVALLADAAGTPVLSATVAAVRPPASAADHSVWRQYDAAGRLIREAASSGTLARAAVTETRYDGASRVVEVVRYANTVAADGSVGSVAPGSVPLPAASAQDRSTRNFHDADGRLAGTLDAEGYLTVFRYTPEGQLSERIAYATATNPTLRAAGTLAQLMPAGSAADIREVSLYDGKGQRIGHVDGEGYLTESIYDVNGNVTQTVRYATRVAGSVAATSSLATLRPVSSASDRASTHVYDALNRVTQTINAEGTIEQFSHDAAGNLVSTVRAAGTGEVRTLLARYDAQGRLTAELSAQGAALLTGGQTQAQVDAIWTQYGTTYTYDAASRRTSATDPLGNRTLFFYDADGALTHTVNALGEVQESRYDARGRVVEQVTYANRISTGGLAGGLVPASLSAALASAANPAADSRSTFTYTRDSQVATATDALGTVRSSSYNAFGEEISSQLSGAALSLAETYAIDRRGLRTGSARDTTGVNVITSAVHDAFGRMIRAVDANGNVREQGYDRLGRVISTRDPLNALRSTSYDAFARVLTQTDALGNSTSYAYDASARSMTVTTAEGIVSTTRYTRHGQVQSFADGKGKVTSYSYDRNGRLLQTATPLTTTASVYDAAGRLTGTTDANGTKIAYTYDAASRVLTRRVDPTGLNLTTSYQYDGKGQRVSVTDANGVVTTTEFDRQGRVLKQTVDPAGLNLQTVYTYDGAGNTLTVRSPAGATTQYVYDALGRRTQERVDPAGLNLQRSWTYDANGNVRSSTDARGNVTRYAYDANDRLVFTLDPLGNLKQVSHDAQGRLVRSVAYATRVSMAALPASPGVADIQPLVIAQAALDLVEHRVYDKDSRVTATVDGTGAVVRYTYDASGNVEARTAYAARIGMTTWTPGTAPAPVADATRDQVQRTVYDGLNRAIYSMDGTGAVVATSYDGNGNVLQRTAYATPIFTNTPLTAAGIAAAVAAVANPARDATVRNSYDAAGRLTWTADGTGSVTQRVYDRNGNVVRQVAFATPVAAAAAPSSVVASGNDRATAMAYDTANRLVFEIDGLRGVTEQVFDADGHVLRRTSYANAIATVPTLGAAGTVAAIRAAIGPNAAADRSTRHGYDQAGRLALTIDAAGSVTERRYDAAGNTVAVVSYANAVNAGALAANAGLAALTALVTANAADRTVRNAYDAGGQLAYAVDAMGAVTASQYDGVGRLTRTTRYSNKIDPALANTAPAIAAALVADAAKDRVNVLGYNAAGQLIASTDPLNGVESHTYDALGRKLTFVNKKGSTWTYTYDAAGRMLTETSPVVELHSVSVDAGGNIVPAAGVNAAVVTRLAYDALGNLTQRTEAAGRGEERTTRYEYDALGRQVRVIFHPVGVYNAAADAATSNGAAGLASRVETVQALETKTFYDALGNAVASRDAGGAVSQKAYDLLGRVAYEVDALGYVTGYTRNAFGEVTALKRYAAATALSGAGVSQASQAASKAQVEAALNAAGVDHSRDRTLLTTYDRAGRVVETSEPAAFVYDSSALAGSQTANAEKKTVNVYDAFGQRVQLKVLRNSLTQTWATTTSYFDKAGRETASVDALGYLTTRAFDSLGNLTEVMEYANAISGSWTTAGYTAPAANAGNDRKTQYAYDRLDRKTAETRLNVEFSTAATGTSTRGNVVTLYGYDAVGNQTQVTDAGGKVTYTYYDALGRIRAVAAPARASTVTGASLTPLTVFRRDAYGNVLARIDHANGASAANASAFTAGPADAGDRTARAAYDSHGRTTQTTDAAGASQYFSYDAHGHVAKNWQPVTGGDGVTRTAFAQNFYDKLGQLVETRTPASTSVYQDGVGISTVTQAQAGVVSTALEYNAFGELTRKGAQGGRQEYFDYDNAGRLWRTNTGDGVDRVQLHDLQGNVTAEIRSSGSGRDNIDIKGFVSAEAAAANLSTRRVDVQYDALGRVTAKYEAARQELQGGVAVQRQFTTASIPVSAHTTLDENGVPVLGGTNRVSFGWNSLGYLGSGDTKVYFEYRTPLVGDSFNEDGIALTYRGGTLRSYSSGIFNGDAFAGGLTVEWRETVLTNDVGVGTITRLVVYKKDVNGNWQAVIDQAPGYGHNEITVAAPPNATTGVTLQMRAAGSAGDTGWWTAGLVNFGNALRFDTAGLAAGNYEYRVTLSPANEPARVTGTGTVGITPQPLNSINANIRYGHPATPAGVMAWDNPPALTTQTFRYRANGSTGGWSTLTVASQTYPSSFSSVDTRGLPAGTYQYELLWAPEGHGVATAHATGTFTVVAEVPPQWVPPVNLPNITGVAIGTGNVGGTIASYDESGQPVYSGGTTVPALQWTAAGATVARYRLPGGAWNSLAIDSAGQSMGESGYTGTQKVLLNGIAPGTYQFEILAGSPPTAQATATVTIYAQNPGWYETVYVQVPVSTPVVAYYQPIYETRYGTRTVAYQVYVVDSSTPVISGYDEAGNPIYARDESGNIIYNTTGHYETRYYTETYAYQVQVGQTPVYATDENGNIVYTVTYQTEARQVWREGSTPAPTVQVTTPPYSPGYWTPYRPAQFGVSVSTAPGSVALSTGENSAISQATALNGDARWLRPTVQQKTDRWGNVIEITDPRAAYWKTTYRYNASNQLVQQTLPDTGTGAPTTFVYYDKLGRQVAVKDANGNVNGQAFDAGGNLVEELHADGGVVRNAYNAFGERVRTTDAMGKVVAYAYDKMGHLLRTTRGQVGVYSVTGVNTLVQVDTRNIVESWTYDQMGRKLSQANGNGELIRYTYDLAGNLVATQQPLGQLTRAAFDAQGRKTGEVDANGHASSWTYDYFGLLTAHMDLGGARYSYQYDFARQLTHQSSTRGQSISYGYDAAGQVTTIQDWANGKTTTYAYDLSGRKLRERVVQGGITYQDNHLAYDARGNLRDVADARAHVVMEYDKAGNRTRVATFVNYQGTSGETSSGSDRYFKYDAMNRQVVVDAVDAAGSLGTQGHQITYDKNGNRTSDTYWGNKVVTSGGEQVLAGYDEDGKAIYSTTALSYTRTVGYSREDYGYDGLDRLQSVVKDGTQIDVRFYDGANRVVQSGPAAGLPVGYAERMNEGLAPDEVNGKEIRINRYDANGRMLHQKILKSDGSAKMDISWDRNEAYHVGWSGLFNEQPVYWNADGYDNAGNALGYIVQSHEGGYVNEFTTGINRYEGYQAGATNGTSTKLLPGSSTQQYDQNGFLIGLVDSTQGNNNRTFVNDASGRALFVNQAGNIQRQLIVDGELLGLYGVGVNQNNPVSGLNNNPNFANVVDFDFGYARVSAGYPNASPGAYTVRTGDTLQSIAQSAYGDSALWYRIADANGLASNKDLRIGQTVNIPNRVSTVHNNGSTFIPYDPSEIEGDKAPSLATPKPKKKGGFLKQLIAVILTIVVAYFTGIYLGGTFSVNMSVLSAQSVAVAAAAGAAGSVAGQAFGLATGMQDSFSWKGVALAALSAGVTQGVTPGLVVGKPSAGVFGGNIAANAALSNALTQGIGVATGLQKKFDWRGVAASAVGAGVGQGVSGPLADAFGNVFKNAPNAAMFAARLATGVLAGAAAAVMRGGKVAVQQVAVDAFGNALGSSLGQAASNPNVPPPVSAQEKAEILGLFKDGPGVQPSVTHWDVGAARDKWIQTGEKPMFDFGDNPYEVGVDKVAVGYGAGKIAARTNTLTMGAGAEMWSGKERDGIFAGGVNGSLAFYYQGLDGVPNPSALPLASAYIGLNSDAANGYGGFHQALSKIGINSGNAGQSAVYLVPPGMSEADVFGDLLDRLGRGFSQQLDKSPDVQAYLADRIGGAKAGQLVNITDFWQSAVGDTVQRAYNHDGGTYFRDVIDNGGTVPIASKVLGGFNLRSIVAADDLAPQAYRDYARTSLGVDAMVFLASTFMPVKGLGPAMRGEVSMLEGRIGFAGLSETVTRINLLATPSKGTTFESLFYETTGLSKYTGPKMSGKLPNGMTRNTVPDLVQPGNAPVLPGITDLKNVGVQAMDSQLQAQLSIANKQGVPFNVVVAPSTQVYRTVIEQSRLTGGNVYVWNPLTKAFRPY